MRSASRPRSPRSARRRPAPVRLQHAAPVGVGDDDVTREYDGSGDCDWLLQPAGAALEGSNRGDRAGEHRHPALGGASASRTAPAMTKPPTPIDLADADQVSDECPGQISEPVDDNDVAGCARSRGSNPGPRSGVEEDDGSICPGGFATSSCWWWAAVARCGLCAGSERLVTAPRSGICVRSSFVRGRSECCGESGDLLRPAEPRGVAAVDHDTLITDLGSRGG